MIRSLIVASVLMSGGYFVSAYHFLYPRAGKQYISKHRELRKSIRHGSGYYYGARGFRGGK